MNFWTGVEFLNYLILAAFVLLCVGGFWPPGSREDQSPDAAATASDRDEVQNQTDNDQNDSDRHQDLQARNEQAQDQQQ